MNTITTLACRLADRTAARVRSRSIALASPGLVPVATQEEASSATCETPMMAIVTPLIVGQVWGHAAAALAPIPTHGTGRPGRRERVGQPGRPVVQDHMAPKGQPHGPKSGSRSLAP